MPDQIIHHASEWKAARGNSNRGHSLHYGGKMTRSTVFKTNRSQDVRLPKEVAFPEGVHEVEITVIGSSRIITPIGKRWDDLFAGEPRASADFMPERVQPVARVGGYL